MIIMSDLIRRQAAIDALERKKDKNAKGDLGGFYNKIIQNDIDALMQLPSAQPEHRRWNHHEVAYIIADLFGDSCACNFNGIDEWLPTYCDFSSTCCPHPNGVACWEQYLKHLDKRHDEVGE